MAADEAARPEVPEARASIARRIGHNIGIVLGGNVAAAGFGLVTLALNARALGTSGLGVLALIITIASLVDRIAAFQTWQPLVKLGADALAVGDKRRVGQLITVALLFDAIAAIAAAVAAVLIVLLAGEWLGIPPEYLGVAAIYMATLVTRLPDAPAGVMRLFDRFGLHTSLRAGEAAAQCLVAGILFAFAAPLGVYVLSFAAVAVAANIATVACSLYVAARMGVSPAAKGLSAALAAEWREFWAFSWVMSVTAIINTVRDRAPVLLIGVFLGPASVGIYHVAERIAGILGTTMWPFHQALFPEVARLERSGRRKDLQWFVLRIGALCGGIGLAALLGAIVLGELALQMVGGTEFGDAYWPLVLLISGYCFAMVGIGLRSTVAVTTGPRALLRSMYLPFLPFTIAIIPAIVGYGLVGAAAAQVLFWLLWILIIFVEFRQWVSLGTTDKAPHER